MGMGGGNINYVQMQVVKVSWICYPTAIYILTISNWKSFFVLGPLSFCFCVNYLTIYFFFFVVFSSLHTGCRVPIMSWCTIESDPGMVGVLFV